MKARLPRRAFYAVTGLLAIIAAASLILLAATNPIGGRTDTVTTSANSTDLTITAVNGDFDQHLDRFSSRNTSAILEQYAPGANVTWDGIPCIGGTYYVANVNDSLAGLLNLVFFGMPRLPGFETVLIGNNMGPVTTVVGNRATTNSTFDLVAKIAGTGNSTATVLAQDSYSYSTSTKSWLISQETWDFTKLQIPDNSFMCD